MMNTSEINQLIEKFEHSSIREMSIHEGNFNLYLSKNERNHDVVNPQISGVTKAMGMEKLLIPAENASSTENDGKQNYQEISEETKTATVTSADKQINAPIVGTFYRSASPDDKPFVMIGQQMKKGDVVGIVEAMKMMNEIHATEDGEVTQILVEDGEMVEFGQAIIRYK